MRKLIFLLFLIPAIAALGHDIYIFTQNQDKGFQLSDLGALWAKYHEESHDNWKLNIQDMGEQINELIPASLKEATTQTTQEVKTATEDKPDYAQDFSQLDSKEEKESIALPPPEPTAQENTSAVQSIIGTMLRQKAAILFGGIALFLYLMNALFSKAFKPKDGMSAVKKHKKGQKGGYQYNRK